MPDGWLGAALPPPRNPMTPPGWLLSAMQGVAQPFLDAGNMVGDALRTRQMPAPSDAMNAGVGLAMALLGPKFTPKGIRAYHGSPYDFDRFDLSKIGTGEGAQAYGHGLYFAENPEVAGTYRDVVTRSHNGEQQFGRFMIGTDEAAPAVVPPPGVAISSLKKIGEERSAISNAELLKRAYDYLDWAKSGRNDFLRSKNTKIAEDTIQYLKDNPTARFVGTPYQGRMYEVNINAHPDQFLDWDKPLSKQPSGNAILPLVQDATRNDVLGGEAILRGGQWVHPSDLEGMDAYRVIGKSPSERPDAMRATALLKEAGIPGIKYLDQGSRSAGTGTNNYVVFDDKLIDILKKYGLVGGLFGAGASQLPEGQAAQ